MSSSFAALVADIERQSFCWLLRNRLTLGDSSNPPGRYFAHVHNDFAPGGKAWGEVPLLTLRLAFAGAIDSALRAPGDPPPEPLP